MRGVGMQALGATRVPDAAVALPVPTAVLRPANLAYALVRAAVAAVRARRPAVGGLVTALRTRPAGPRWPGAVPAGPSVAHAGGRAVPRRHREVDLPADATAPRLARALLRSATQDWGVDDDVHEDAAMVVTELVANAVDHAGTPSTLVVELDGRGLCVAVRDGRADRAPRPRPVDPSAPRGRGLQMIDALCASWGVTVHDGGKTVWAVVRGS